MFILLFLKLYTSIIPSHEEGLDDVGCNADLYAFKQGAFQGCSNHDRSQQALVTDPHCFQQRSLDYVLAAQLGFRFHRTLLIYLSIS